MTYTPINWQTGDTITAEKLNRCDNGWAVENTQLFSETVTTEAGEYGNEGMLAYGGHVTATSITATFGGTDYQCSAIEVNGGEAVGYGGITNSWEYDFTTYPFALVSTGDANIIATETAGSYSVSASNETVATSENFNAAVESVVPVSMLPMICSIGQTTYAEMAEARDAKRLMYVYLSRRNCVLVNSVPNDQQDRVGYYPSTSGLALGFDGNGVLEAVQ